MEQVVRGVCEEVVGVFPIKDIYVGIRNLLERALTFGARGDLYFI